MPGIRPFNSDSPMGLFCRFFGPPTPRSFAKKVVRTLRAIGDKRTITIDDAEFRLQFVADGEPAGHAKLQNLYAEYCRMPRRDRSRWLQSSCRTIAHTMEVPEDFEDVKPDLFPTVRTRSLIEVIELEARLNSTGSPTLPTLPLNDELIACLVYDLPNAMRFVTQDNLQTWGVSTYEAFEVARRNLDEKPASVVTAGERLFMFCSLDAYDGSRLLLTDKIRTLPLRGDPITMPVTRDCLLVTGEDDVEGLALLVDVATKSIEEPRSLCPIAFRLVGDDWQSWLPPVGHPQYQKLREFQLRYQSNEYATQKDLLDKLHEKEGPDVFVATYEVVQKPDGTMFSYATWAKGVATWLPQADKIAFFDPDVEQPLLVPWEVAIAEIGATMQPLDCNPSRWEVNSFPSAEELERMNVEPT